jgi:hypothetical protein
MHSEHEELRIECCSRANSHAPTLGFPADIAFDVANLGRNSCSLSALIARSSALSAGRRVQDRNVSGSACAVLVCITRSDSNARTLRDHSRARGSARVCEKVELVVIAAHNQRVSAGRDHAAFNDSIVR